MCGNSKFFEVMVNYDLSWTEMLMVGGIERLLFDTKILPRGFKERGKRGGFVTQQVKEIRIPCEMDDREVAEYVYDESGCVCTDLPTFLQWAGMYSFQKKSNAPLGNIDGLAENIRKQLEDHLRNLDLKTLLSWVKMCKRCVDYKFYYSVSTIDTPFMLNGERCFLTYRVLEGKMTLGLSPVGKSFPVNTCFLVMKI